MLAQTITDAQVNAAENVVVYDYIINSKVNAGNNLDIPTHHGYAHGGTLQAGNLIRLPKVGPPEEFTKEEDEVEELPTTTTMLKSAFLSPAENNSIRCWKTSKIISMSSRTV